MKIDVTQDALLRALVEPIRDERDFGGALMRLMLRFMNQVERSAKAKPRPVAKPTQRRKTNGAGKPVSPKKAKARPAAKAASARKTSVAKAAKPAAKPMAVRKAGAAKAAKPVRKTSTAKAAKPAVKSVRKTSTPKVAKPAANVAMPMANGALGANPTPTATPASAI
jgi:hypothetical protein